MTEIRYPVAELRTFAAALFRAAGVDAAKAETIGTLLVEADLMGHATHGLALAPRYLDDIERGDMARSGDPEVLHDRGACVTWNGRRLSGQWLTAQAVDLAVERANTYGMASVAIRDSHHIGCLAVYLSRATDLGLMIILTSTNPGLASVAPYGGTKALFTPNPFAVGIPTTGDPILIDTSASITTNNMNERLLREGRVYDHDWLLDADGKPTNDPSVMRNGGSLLLAGGLDHGQKGYAWALLSEALTQGLTGFGRAEQPQGRTASVYVQIVDPAAFGGRDAFTRETGWLADACRANPPRPDVDQVRLPGQQAAERRRTALAQGVALHPGIMDALSGRADTLGVPRVSRT